MPAAANANVTSSIYVGIIVTFLSMAIWLMLRRKYRFLFMTRAFMKASWAPEEKPGFFEWVPYTLSYSERKLAQSPGGTDTVIYLRFLKYSIALLSLYSLVGLAVLMPLYNSRFQEGSKDTTGLDAFSISSLPAQSKLLWIPLLSVWVFTLMAWYYLYHNYNSYVELTNSHKENDTVRNRSVMVTNIPSPYRSNEGLLNYFRELYGPRVLYAEVVPNVEQLWKKVQTRESYVKQYHRARDSYLERGRKKIPMTRDSSKSKWNAKYMHAFGENLPEFTGTLLCFGREVSAEEFYKVRVEKLDEEITLQQLKYTEGSLSNLKMSSLGFVTFDSVQAAMLCAQALHNKNPLLFYVKQAPDPRDLIWRWVTSTKEERFIRRLITIGVLILLFIFWSVPVAAISAFSNVETLSNVGGLGWMISILSAKSPAFRAFLVGFLPSLALNIFMALLPYILRFIIHWRGALTYRERELDVLRTYWLFLVLNVFLVTAIAGSIFDILSKLLKNPEQIVDLLSASLPSQAVVFSNYIIVQALISYPIFFMTRLQDFLLCKIKHWFFCHTKRERREAELPDPPFDFAVQYARESLVLGIGLTYSTMSPIILPFAVLLFMIAYLSAKHNFVFVYDKPQYEGVKMAPSTINFIFVSILIYHLTMMGIFGLKLFPAGGSIILLMIMTIAFKYSLDARFAVPSKFLALENCPKPTQDSPFTQFSLQNHYIYKHPALEHLKPIEQDDEEESMKQRMSALKPSISSENEPLLINTE